MSDREMLILLYGALKAIKTTNQDLLKMLEKHLFLEKKA